MAAATTGGAQVRGRGGEVRFDGQVAVVTGAGRGLGREFAMLLARRGAAVVVNDIGVSADADRYAGIPDSGGATVADQVAEEIVTLGGRAVGVRSDVGDPAGAGLGVETAIERFGRIDIVVNNAGVVIARPLDQLTQADLATVFRVHVLGGFNVVKAAWPAFTGQGYGRVVNVCSVEGGLTGTPEYEVYASAKGGVVGLTRALALHAIEHGVAVNGLLPAGDTRGSSLSPRRKARAGRVDRGAGLVAPAAAWLCHEDCDVSGRFFAVTGGSMRLVYTERSAVSAPLPAEATPEALRDRWASVTPRELPPGNR